MLCSPPGNNHSVQSPVYLVAPAGNGSTPVSYGTSPVHVIHQIPEGTYQLLSPERLVLQPPCSPLNRCHSSRISPSQQSTTGPNGLFRALTPPPAHFSNLHSRSSPMECSLDPADLPLDLSPSGIRELSRSAGSTDSFCTVPSLDESINRLGNTIDDPPPSDCPTNFVMTVDHTDTSPAGSPAPSSANSPHSSSAMSLDIGSPGSLADFVSPRPAPAYCAMPPPLTFAAGDVDPSPQNLQPEDLSTQLSSGSVASMPNANCRVGNELHLLFPTSKVLGCTETGCGEVYSCKKWSSTKQSVIRHLGRVHNLYGLNIIR